MSVEALERAWFTASTSSEQLRAVDALVEVAGGGDWGARRPATTALIELVHLTQHPGERAFLVRKLGRCRDSFQAVPALHAETQHPDPTVRRAAFEGLGLLGIPFGGALVRRFFSEQALRDEPREVLHAALLALARTSHPSIHEVAQDVWTKGRISPSELHEVLAEAHSDCLLDVAREHLHHPEAACAAALHLASAQPSSLEDDLRPLLDHPEPVRARVASTLLLASARPVPVGEQLLEVMDGQGSYFERARRARTLRGLDVGEVCRSFEALTEGEAPERLRGWCANLLLAGIPALQDAILDFIAAGDPAKMARVVEQVSFDSPGLAAHLRRWLQSSDERVATAAIRAASNAFGAEALPLLAHFATSKSERLRHERVRAVQNAFRDQRNSKGRTRVAQSERVPWERSLGEAMQDEAELVRYLAAYAAGNIGFTGLAGALERLLDPGQPVSVRQAAATGLFELRVAGRVDRLAEAFLQESAEAVHFRLLLCLRRALLAGETPTEAVRRAVAQASASSDPRTAVLGTLLVGHSGDVASLESLRSRASGGTQALARAATASLGVLGTEAAVMELVGIAGHEDGARRMVAAEALGATGSPLATDVLVRLVMHEEDPDIRRAAVLGLQRCPLPPERLAALRPRGPDDPLLLEILEARMASRDQAGRGGAAAIDAVLESEMVGFKASRLERRRPDALRALRTAEYLAAASDVPAGLDASPPVLFWVKGLEIWLHEALAAVVTRLRSRDVVTGLQYGVQGWDRQKRALPRAWRAPAGVDTWRHLLNGLVEGLADPPSRVPSLRVAAAALLVQGPLASAFGLGSSVLRLSPDDAQSLAEHLTMLAAVRNRLTHTEAGTSEQAAEARRLALAAGGLVARIF